MGCPHVRGDNPRALASGLSYVQVDKHGRTIFTTYIIVDLGQHEIFRAKVGKGGIIGAWEAQWLSGRVLDSRPRGRGFEPHRRHCVVVLEQDTFILAYSWFSPGRPVPV